MLIWFNENDSYVVTKQDGHLRFIIQDWSIFLNRGVKPPCNLDLVFLSCAYLTVNKFYELQVLSWKFRLTRPPAICFFFWAYNIILGSAAVKHPFVLWKYTFACREWCLNLPTWMSNCWLQLVHICKVLPADVSLKLLHAKLVSKWHAVLHVPHSDVPR